MKSINRIPRELGIISQVQKASKSRVASTIGFILGGVVPVGVYWIAHHEAEFQPWKWGLVTAGLIYSAKTVFDWARIAFKHPAKALGFVVLLEGIMTSSTTLWLQLVCLTILVGINGTSAACQLALDRR